MINIAIRLLFLIALLVIGAPLWVLALYVIAELTMMIVNYVKSWIAAAECMKEVLNSNGPEDMSKKYQALYKNLAKNGAV